MAKREIKIENATQIIFEGKRGGYSDGDVLAVAFETRNHGTLHRFYTLGSVVGCAIKYCECPMEAVIDAKERGHKLHWANQNAVTISDRYSDKKAMSFLVEYGDEIKFHGKMFEIVATHNNNIDLKIV